MSCLQDRMKDNINLEHIWLCYKTCVTNWINRIVVIFQGFLYGVAFMRLKFVRRKELQRGVWNCCQKTLMCAIWGSKALMSKPEETLKKVIFKNRKEILKAALKRRALDTEKTKCTNNTLFIYLLCKRWGCTWMTCFCNDHQTLFLDVNIYLLVSLGVKSFALLYVPFECE